MDALATDTPPVLLTVEAAAHHLSISRTTMYSLIRSGHVTSIQIGRLRRVPTEALTAYTARLITEQQTS